MKKSRILAYASRLIGVGLTFILSTFLARVLGADDFGTYSFLISLTMLLTLPTQSALPIMALRNVAKSESVNGKTILSKSTRLLPYVIMLYAFIAIFIITLVNEFIVAIDSDEVELYWIFPLLVIIPLSLLYSSMIRGCGPLITSMVPEYVVKPFATIILVLYFYYMNASFDVTHAISSVTISGVIILAFYFLYLQGVTVKSNTQSREKLNIKEFFNLSVISGGQVIFANIEVFFLGFLSTTSDVGIYKVALVISVLIIFSQTVINQIIQPDIVKKYHEKDLLGLQQVIKNSSLIITSLGLLFFVLLVSVGKPLIVYFYGADYESAYYILLVLSFGQIVNMAFGSVGTILNMTKNESHAVNPMLFTIIINVVLDIMLIYLFGVYGAATAAVISMVLWNVLLRRQVLKRTGIESSGVILLFKG